MFVSSEATILHADVDSFFASVEQRDDPRLRGRPVIVGGWVVLAASYEAKAAGVKTAMSAAEARRRCPEVIVVQPRMRAYSEASKAMFAVFETHRRSSSRSRSTRRSSTCVGCGGWRDRPRRSRSRLRRDVRERVGLPITVGVARTKFLAKVASGVAKPDGLLVVEPDRELEFLHPLAVERLWGVGPATARKLHAVRLLDGRRCRRAQRGDAGRPARSRIGPAALCAVAEPRRAAGAAGSPSRLDRGAARARPLVDLARGARRHARRARRPHHPPDAGGGARRANRRPAASVRRLLAGDAQSHAAPLDGADARDPRDGAGAARGRSAARSRRGLTLVGISVANLETDDAVQLVLPFADDGQDAVDSAVDAVRNRFGTAAITRGVLVGRDGGFEMPHLPD